MFVKNQSQLVTAKQLENILSAWNADVILPTNKKNQIICFPGGTEYVELSIWKKQKDSNYKGKMYRIDFYFMSYAD